jgi:hypothetical protein
MQEKKTMEDARDGLSVGEVFFYADTQIRRYADTQMSSI